MKVARGERYPKLRTSLSSTLEKRQSAEWKTMLIQGRVNHFQGSVNLFISQNDSGKSWKWQAMQRTMFQRSSLKLLVKAKNQALNALNSKLKIKAYTRLLRYIGRCQQLQQFKRISQPLRDGPNTIQRKGWENASDYHSWNRASPLKREEK